MKTLIKITALAVLVALAAFSCTPEAELSDVDWNGINSKYNAGKNSSPVSPDDFSYTSSLSIGVDADNELNLTFPPFSDFLRNSSEAKVESGLGQFLSFYHFTKATEPIAGKADTIGSSVPYTYVKRNGPVITVKLNKTFVAADSNVVMKIDGTKYTYGNGNKLDLVRRGSSGVAGYDDFYKEINVGGATGPSDFVAPGNKGWYLALRPIDLDDANTAGILTRSPIAYLGLGDIEGEEANITTIATAVADQLKSGLNIQKLVNGSWTPVNATINYDSEYNSFMVASLPLDDLVPYRVMWEGSAPVTTTAEYYGVKQYIAIRGSNTNSTLEYYRTSKVYGPVTDVWYTDRQRFSAPVPSIIHVSKDSRHRNVGFELVFDSVTYGTPTTTYWLKNFNSDKQKFKDNFKIAYYGDRSNPEYPGFYDADETFFTSRPDLVYVDIKDFEFFSHNPEKNDDIGLNAIRITLDPAYEDNKTLYFYISPEIRYTDDKTTFGDPSNFLHGFFKAYKISGLAETPFPDYPMLIPGVWTEGNLDLAESEEWYSILVTAGNTYYIWWNSRQAGDGSKTAVAVIGARYEGSGYWLIGGTDTEVSTISPRSFTATQDGFVEIRIIPYLRYSTYTGSYDIGYSTDYYTSPNY
jgi:hypothetical protein